MASDNEASCESDPNFAVICAFMEKFGTTCGLQTIDFLGLQEMLENTQEVPQELIDLHIKLLRKSRKSVSNERWERAIIKFCHSFCVQDAWEIERFGYKKARLSSKLRVLKELLEMQFDCNARFKAEINKMSAEELRSQPLGKDKHGHAYWFQNDNNCQIRVYKEDPDEETWSLVAKDREGLASLISELSDGDSKISSESAINEEDSNSLAEKPIIDTGQVESSSDSNKKMSGDSDNSNQQEDVITNKRPHDDDDDNTITKKTKLDENPIVGEEIEEEVIVFRGEGNGADCETGNEDKPEEQKDSQSIKKSAETENSVSISDSKNCVNDEVPTSPIKSPYKLGTIFDTKTDNKFFSTVNKSSTKKSRWDVETIIAKEPNKWEQEEEKPIDKQPKKSMFFFGPGCLQFSPAVVGFGQKVPPEQKDVEDCVQSSDLDQDLTPIESKVVDNLEKGSDSDNIKNIEEQIISNESQEVDGCGKIPEVTAALIGFKENRTEEDKAATSALAEEEVCVKKEAYVLGGQSEDDTVKENENFAEELKVDIEKHEESKKVVESLDSMPLDLEENKNSVDISYTSSVDDNKLNKEDKVANIDENKNEQSDESYVNSVDLKSDEVKSSESRDFSAKKSEENDGISVLVNDPKSESLKEPVNIKDLSTKIEEKNESAVEDEEECNKQESPGRNLDDKKILDEDIEQQIVSFDLNQDENEKNAVVEESACESQKKEDIKIADVEKLVGGETAASEGKEKIEEAVSETTAAENQKEDIKIADVEKLVVRDTEASEIKEEIEKAVSETTAAENQNEEIEKITDVVIPASEGTAPSEDKKENEKVVIVEDSREPEKIVAENQEEEIEKIADVERPVVGDETTPSEVNEENKKVAEVKDSKEPEAEILEEEDKKFANVKNVEEPEEIASDIKEVENKKIVVACTETALSEIKEETKKTADMEDIKEPQICTAPALLEVKNEETKDEIADKNAIVCSKEGNQDETEGKIEGNKEEDVPASAKRGRKNNISEESIEEEKKPRLIARRTTRSSKHEEEEKIEVPSATRRGRQRTNQKTKEDDLDSNKKMKLSAEQQQQEVKEESENAAETVVVESSNNSDIAIIEKDPLEASDQETKEVEETKDKPLSLSTFSLDFNESPSHTPPATRSGLRKRGHESPQNLEEVEETGGKRPKMKAKRAVDVKLRKSIEEQKKKELISSDDDNKNEDEKKGKKKHAKKGETEGEDGNKDAEPSKKKTINKNKRILSNLGIDIEQASLVLEIEPTIGVRQSRRIAQLKIKEEAERRKLEEEMAQDAQKKKKSKKCEDKDYKVEKKKSKDIDDDDVDDETVESKKRKKKKKKHKMKFDEHNPWKSSSDSSSSNEEDEMGEEEEEEEDDVLQYVSDHEFSPESDLEGDGEALPLKRARTVRKESDVEEEIDDCPCQKCGKSDHPEWILLCDSCDNGWHCSCLRPPLLVIPEGDWFCPPCQHASLLSNLQEKLKEYDKSLNKKEIENRRKERLAYVGISLNSVLPTKDTENIKKRKYVDKDLDDDDDDEDDDVDDDRGDDDDADEELDDEESSSEASESGTATESETASDSDEPIYQLRQRRQAHSYRFNDYDELINSAIQDEMEAVKGAGNQGRGKDIATIVNAEKEEERKKEVEDENTELEPLPPVVPIDEKDKEPKPVFNNDDEVVSVKKKIIGRKKHRKLNALDISDDDDDEDSDEDFKGTSSEDEEDDDFDEELGSEDSEDLDSGRGRRRGDPIRRSTRARTSRYDADFIDDGESDSEDEAPRRKKKRSFWEESESEESDRSWGRRKRKATINRSRKTTSNVLNKKKKSKKKKKQQDSDEEVYKKKKPKIKFGLEGDEDGPVRRTRGKKINYVDALGSDSDEDRVKRPPPKIDSDEEYVANEDDEKISEEEGESNKQPKIQIQSYTDARFTQILPEPKSLMTDEIDNELNPIDQINRNVEMMDENEMEKMMEEEEYANKQLQMVAQQLEKEKRRKEREAKKLEDALQQTPLSPKDQLAKKVKKQKEQFQFSGSMQEPLVGNVDNLIINSENNDELSEPPGVSLPLFAELGNSGDGLEDPMKKRRGKTKKSLEEAVANLGSVRQPEAPASSFISLPTKNHSTDLTVPPDSNIEIAAPPQPFSQSQPTPSVITRMLQNKPGQPGYPVGAIRPKQFAAITDREEDVHVPVHPAQYLQNPRPQILATYRQMAPTINHYPRNAPPQIRNPVPHIYHSHRPLDPSPSGGGPITLTDHNSPSRVVSPASSSPGSNKNETPPPPYSRPSVPTRFPMISTSAGGPRHIPMVPPHLQPPRPSLSPYHPGMPPQYHYGQFGQDDALPPTIYHNSAAYPEQFEGHVVNQSENSNNSKSYEEESGGGEFGGLVSYFSSQREDDLES